VDDARLVVLNAMDAAARGADIRVRTEVQAAHRAGSSWRIDLRDAVSGRCETMEARALVNASGAWVATSGGRIKAHPVGSVRLVKGSHIVVPRLYDHDSAYVLQNPDRRVVFAIPYEGDFTLIGTTDVDYTGNLDQVAISPEEVAYLCEAANRYFTRAIAPADVIWSYAGVRALHDDGQAAAQETTRDFVLELDGAASGEAPLLSIVGGKLTTYRRVTEEVLARLVPLLPVKAGPAWTGGSPLPGGDFPYGGHGRLARELLTAVPFLGQATAERLVRSYGTMARRLLADVKCQGDLGAHFGAGLYEREVRHLLDNEWARTADDILWRRTKLGLRLSPDERGRLEAWLRAQT
jgi:glycerol-3-phosphate dehydrogenase